MHHAYKRGYDGQFILLDGASAAIQTYLHNKLKGREDHDEVDGVLKGTFEVAVFNGAGTKR